MRRRCRCNWISMERCWIASSMRSTRWDGIRKMIFRVLVLLLKHLETIWQDPDEGIWETRGGPQQFTYSKMMAWVAFDRAVLLAEQMNYKAPIGGVEGDQGDAFISRFAREDSTPRRTALCRRTGRMNWMLRCC